MYCIHYSKNGETVFFAGYDSGKPHWSPVKTLVIKSEQRAKDIQSDLLASGYTDGEFGLVITKIL